MRKIKFRAWENNRMQYFPELKSWNTDTWLPEEGTILMQYTGLKDKNGKEIWEGDVVRHLGRDINLKVSIGGYWPTEGDNGNGVHVHNEDETFVEGVSAFNQDNNLEVIGNIYESPELLDNK